MEKFFKILSMRYNIARLIIRKFQCIRYSSNNIIIRFFVNVKNDNDLKKIINYDSEYSYIELFKLAQIFY